MELIDNSLVDDKQVLRKKIKLALFPAAVFCVFLWLVFVVDMSGLIDYNFSKLGIYPLKLRGLAGILFSPFIHASFSHLVSNTIPLFVLISLIFYFYNQIAFKSMSLLWILSGFLTWLIGRSSYHVGASGLVFALVFYLFFSGLLRRYIRLSAVSLVVAFAYGGTVWSMLPVTEFIDVSISWEAHLSGAVAGLIVAFLYKDQGPQKPVVVWDDDEEEKETDDEFQYWLVNQDEVKCVDSDRLRQDGKNDKSVGGDEIQ